MLLLNRNIDNNTNYRIFSKDLTLNTPKSNAVFETFTKYKKEPNIDVRQTHKYVII